MIETRLSRPQPSRKNWILRDKIENPPSNIIKSNTEKINKHSQFEHYLCINKEMLKLLITCIQVSSQSWPNRMITRRSSSARIAWSTAQPEWRCGSKYDIVLLLLESKEARVARVNAQKFWWVSPSRVRVNSRRGNIPVLVVLS